MVYQAGVDGSRTHQGLFCTTPRTVLKTARDTGREPPPATRIHPKGDFVKCGMIERVMQITSGQRVAIVADVQEPLSAM
jgi:hypothetical protein